MNIKRRFVENKIKNLLLSIAKDAGEYSLMYFGKLTPDQISYKYPGKRGIVTTVDIDLDTRIREQILQHFPHHDIISEEKEPINNSEDYVWIIDPIDGTRNYAAGKDAYSISIGIAKGGELILGVIFAPARNEFYFTQKGKGVFLNGKKVKKITSPVKLCFVDQKRTSRMDIVKDHFEGCTQEHLGSAALELAYIAHGKYLGVILENIMIWDIAAGLLMVEELGGRNLNLRGEKYSFNDKDLLVLRD